MYNSRSYDRPVSFNYFIDLLHGRKYLITITETRYKKKSWSESSSELYRPSDRLLSAKRLPTFVDRGFHVVSLTDPYGRILGFLDSSRYFSIK
jgi:hypothetical protein